MSKAREAGTSAMWDREVTIIFCDLCVREVEVGNRPTTFFNKEGWRNIEVKFKEMTGRDYDRMKMKNKWDQLKKDWKLWKELKQGSTGMGWDPVKRTIDAPEEWWAEKLQDNELEIFREVGTNDVSMWTTAIAFNIATDT
ncbi:L10-interacting MYB domain-containing protein-like [Phalaenopsis equestris]|uniref:L10-interacting MYB domain-containing protein-like n=1 Tax=Phalaenopsis equestris TaxID=78828 RepID=UPI0009E2BB1B|nr:L10-interacting MYB domain-containing protein-like [Phalaenopsis equestris]